jgi:hypothetical protein
MLSIELDSTAGLAIVRPEGALTESDFESIAGVIDPYLEERGELNGLIIYTKDFPGWDSFGAMIKHVKFVKNHHQKLSHVALVTDSKFGKVAEKIAGHFVSADVKHFPYRQFAEAKSWILDAKPD